ncbi:MAG: periplasmic heavy metal sensor [Parvibaculaceae bacterium]
MSDQSPPEHAAPARRWLGPVLLVSLVLNLFLIGLFVAGMIYRHGPGGPVHAMLAMQNSIVAQHLSEEERNAFRAAMRPRMRDMRPFFEGVRDARRGVSEAVAAEPYDPDAVRSAFTELRRALMAVGEHSQNAMIEVFADLPPETRARIAEGMLRGPRGHHRPPHGEFRHGEGQDDD